MAATSTSISLLRRLRTGADQATWCQFTDLYTPLLYYWLKKKGVADTDAADVIQEVFLLLMKKLPEFEYDRGKSFRGWLRTVTVNKFNELRRRKPLPINAGLSDADCLAGPEDDDFWEVEYKRQLLEQAEAAIQPEFSQRTWEVYHEYVKRDRPPKEVALQFDVKVIEVYRAKSQILQRLRVFLDGMLE